MAISQGATFCAVTFLITVFGVLGSARFEPCIAAYAAGSLMLGGYAILISLATGYGHLGVVAALTILVKAAAIPFILIRVVRRLGTATEGHLQIGAAVSLIIGAILTVIGYAVSGRFAPGLGSFYHSGLAAGISATLIGMAFVAMRRQALMQLLGLLICENGTLMIGLAIAPDLPLIVEFGVILDVIVAVVIFAGLALSIHEVYDTTDTARLSNLRG
ncbi:MAG TPA: hypothetical protein VFJ58_04490 [Armatimonadota bacterium]|nr:hypothetical protein [Armatimonadota bacterium]